MMMVKGERKEVIFDLEWIKLMKEAKLMGLSPEEVRSFLKKYKETT